MNNVLPDVSPVTLEDAAAANQLFFAFTEDVGKGTPPVIYRAGWLGMDDLILTNTHTGEARPATDDDMRRQVSVLCSYYGGNDYRS